MNDKEETEPLHWPRANYLDLCLGAEHLDILEFMFEFSTRDTLGYV